LPDQRIAVLCVGNILMLDEGVGPRVAQELLEHYEFPSNVAVLDRGTMGLTLLGEFKDYDTILVVDAVDNTGEPAGTVVSFAPEDIAPYATFHSAHDTRFIDVLQAAALLGYTPSGHCLGVQVANMSPEQYVIGLTPAVEAALPLLMESVLAFLSLRGVEITDKQTGRPWQSTLK
jgi:hydrogenase maturation protease